jgi:hypothetical protein
MGRTNNIMTCNQVVKRSTMFEVIEKRKLAKEIRRFIVSVHLIAKKARGGSFVVVRVD